MMGGFGMGIGGLGLLFMVIFWIVIIAAAVWLLSNVFPRSDTTRPSGSGPETAVEILKRRYAHGELSKEEYESMRHDLEN